MEELLPDRFLVSQKRYFPYSFIFLEQKYFFSLNLDDKLGLDERSLSDERKSMRISCQVRVNHIVYSGFRRFKWHVCTQPACNRIRWAPQADEQTRHMLRYTHIYFDMLNHENVYIYINVRVVVFRIRFIEVGFKGCLYLLMLCVCSLSICVLKHTHSQELFTQVEDMFLVSTF